MAWPAWLLVSGFILAMILLPYQGRMDGRRFWQWFAAGVACWILGTAIFYGAGPGGSDAEVMGWIVIFQGVLAGSVGFNRHFEQLWETRGQVDPHAR